MGALKKVKTETDVVSKKPLPEVFNVPRKNPFPQSSAAVEVVGEQLGLHSGTYLQQGSADEDLNVKATDKQEGAKEGKKKKEPRICTAFGARSKKACICPVLLPGVRQCRVHPLASSSKSMTEEVSAWMKARRIHVPELYTGSISVSEPEVKAVASIQAQTDSTASRDSSASGNGSSQRAGRMATIRRELKRAESSGHHPSRFVPNSDMLRGQVYRSCAVVGDSAALLAFPSAVHIDKHEAVFRINASPTRAWESYVGTKTTIRVVHPKFVSFRERRRELLVVAAQNPSDIKEFFSFRLNNSTRKARSDRIYMLSPAFLDYALEEARRADEKASLKEEGHRSKKPENDLDVRTSGSSVSEGWTAFLLALNMCERVALYGWPPFKRTRLHHKSDWLLLPSSYTSKCRRRPDDEEIQRVGAVMRAGLASFGTPCSAECLGLDSDSCTICVFSKLSTVHLVDGLQQWQSLLSAEGRTQDCDDQSEKAVVKLPLWMETGLPQR